MLQDKIRTVSAAKTLRIDGHGSVQKNEAVFEMGESTIAIPAHVQNIVDEMLDYYSENNIKPVIKVSGNPLEIVSNFVNTLQETLPANLMTSGKDFMDFVINSLCDFCRERSIGYMSLNLSFSRGSGFE